MLQRAPIPREQSKRAKRPCREALEYGAVAQLGEHLLCKQGVNGSIPFSSTNSLKGMFETCSNISIRVAQQSARILMLEHELGRVSVARSDKEISKTCFINVADDF